MILWNSKETMSPSSSSEFFSTRSKSMLAAPSTEPPSSASKELSSSFAFEIRSLSISKKFFISSSFNFKYFLCIFSANSLIFPCSIFLFLLLFLAELFSLLETSLLITLIFALKRLCFINFLRNIL